MPYKINNEFKHREFVYLITDENQCKRQVVYICVFDGGALSYGLSCNGEVTEHFEFEISADRDVIG